MDLTLLNLLPILAVIGLVFVAVRAHERYWTLGFLGWRKVYAGLGLYIFAGLLYAVEFWILKSSPGSSMLGVLRAGILISGVSGLALVLAGSIERLRELSAERARLEDIRAGFDLFDSLREIIAQPYSFLEVLDYALKEMVRAAGVDSGGLWLYNPKKPEWILTGWANMPEKLRQQTESITGSGTGFDRLAAAHKARLFSTPEKIRVFFPEWEAEGYQSILGMPLASGVVGSAGRQILGAIVLTDRSAHRFDDDRARRLYAASDYVAAVIAEARITRQLDSSRQQLDGAFAKLEQERREANRQKQDALEQLEQLNAKRNEEEAALKAAHGEQLAEANATSQKQLQDLTAETEARLAAEKTTAGELLQTTRTELEKRLANEKAFAVEKLHGAQAEFERRLADEKSSAAKELFTTKAELEKRLLTETSRVEQLQTRWEEVKHSAEQLEKRMETERAGWEKRLDDLHRQLTSETERARKRETQLGEEHRAYISESDSLFGDLERELETEKQKVTERAASLEAARASLTERESALATERAAREEAAASHRAALESLSEQLAAAGAFVADLEVSLETAQRTHEEMASNLAAEVSKAQQVAGEQLRSAEREIESLRLMVEDREVQLTARHEAEREAMEESGRFQKIAAQEHQLAAESIARLEKELSEERMRCESTEHDIDVLRAEWNEFETRRERDIVEERLDHRRQMHALETLHSSLTLRSRRLLATPSGAERVAAALRCVGDRLPPNTQLYFWQRQPDGAPRMVAWQDTDAHVFRGQALPPWPFEINTIPAEGITRLTSPGQWETLRHEQFSTTLEGWPAHWGEDRTPRWVVCWPWGSSAQESNGWVTAFGFGDVLITDQQIDEAETWVGFLAAALAGTTGTDMLLLPEPEIVSAESEDVLPEPDVNLLDSDDDILRPGDNAELEAGGKSEDTTDAFDEPEEDAEATVAAFSDMRVDEEPSAMAAGEEIRRPGDDAELEAEGMSEERLDAVDELEDDAEISEVVYTDSGVDEEQPAMAVDEGERAVSHQPAPETSQSELHHAVIQWAADQLDDAFNLDLTAHPGVPVNRGWLRRALERGRSSCRQSSQPRVEFDVSTMNENGWTVLRLIRSSESSPLIEPDIAAVEDSDLSASTAEAYSDSIDSGDTIENIPVSGRWLLHGGSTIGMELRFTTKHHDDPVEKSAKPQQDLTIDAKVLLVNDRDSMEELLIGMIEALGGETFAADDFEGAQELIASDEIDVAVVDTTMDDDAGWEIARRLIEYNPEIPVLLIIGSETISIPDDAAGHWLLRMPFQIEELRECLEGVFAARSHEDAASQAE